MKIFKLVQISFICVVLSACSTYSAQTIEPSSNEVSKGFKDEPMKSENTQEKKEDDLGKPIGVNRGHMIDAQIVSPIGEFQTNFTSYSELKVKVYLLNTGTESLLYKIRSVDDKKQVAVGILKMNESFEQVFNDLPEGDYSIFCVVEEEEPPIDLAVTVKVDLME